VSKDKCEYNHIIIIIITIIIITCATGTISKPFRQYLSNILGKHEIKELQKQPYWALHTYFGT
jgi:hypothetical protein